METTLAAVLGGKIVRYPISATFVVERNKGPKKRRFLTHKDNISQALHKFHCAVDEGAGRVRLSAVHKGKLIKLHAEG